MPAKTSKKTARKKTTTRKKAPAKKTASKRKPRAKAEPKETPWEDWGEPGTVAPASAEAEPATATESASKPKATRKPKTTPKRPTSADGAPTTLAELSDRYVEHLKAQGKTESTVWGYGMELKTAMKELGEDAKLAAITPAQVQAFYESDRVTRKRDGTPKAMPGILKTRRVIRLALCWAVEQGWLAEAPVPDLKAKKNAATE